MKIRFNAHTGELEVTQYYEEEGFKREDKRTWSREMVKKLFFTANKDLKNAKAKQEEQEMLRKQQDEIREKQDKIASDQTKFLKKILEAITEKYPVSEWTDDEQEQSQIQNEGSEASTE